MESVAIISRSPLLVGLPSSTEAPSRRWPFGRALLVPAGGRGGAGRRRAAAFTALKEIPRIEKLQMQSFACVTSSVNSGASTVSSTSLFSTPSQSYVGSPLFWVGVGVALSASFSVMATKFKRMAIQQAFKAVMGPTALQNGQFNNAAFSTGSPFPFPAASPSDLAASSATLVASQPVAAGDVSETKVDSTPLNEDKNEIKLNKEATSTSCLSERMAIQQAFKAVMGPTAPQNGQFNNAAFSPGPPYPFPAASPSDPADSSATLVASQPVIAGDVSETKVDSTPLSEDKDEIK